MISLLRMIDRTVVAAALAVAMVLLALMSCVTLYQVATRFVFERPSTWSEVASRSLMIWMVYLGLVAVLRTGSLIGVDMLMNAIPPAGKKLLAVVIAAITLSVLTVMVWYGWAMTMRTTGQTLAGLSDPITGKNISIALVYAAIPVGGALGAIAVIARLAEDLAGRGPTVHEVDVTDI